MRDSKMIHSYKGTKDNTIEIRKLCNQGQYEQNTKAL